MLVKACGMPLAIHHCVTMEDIAVSPRRSPPWVARRRVYAGAKWKYWLRWCPASSDVCSRVCKSLDSDRRSGTPFSPGWIRNVMSSSIGMSLTLRLFCTRDRPGPVHLRACRRRRRTQLMQGMQKATRGGAVQECRWRRVWYTKGVGEQCCRMSDTTDAKGWYLLSSLSKRTVPHRGHAVHGSSTPGRLLALASAVRIAMESAVLGLFWRVGDSCPGGEEVAKASPLARVRW